PTGHAQLGYMDNAAWQNIEDHQIHFSVKPTKKLVIDLKGHFFSLDEEADAWYGVAGGTGWGGGRARIRRGADTVLKNGVLRDVDDDLGQEIDATLKYKLFKNFGVVAGYSHYFADDFIQDTGNNIDRGSDWAYLQTTVKF
ncbi:MAG: alginate export family protein, partial [Candidatus Scalindua sp.]